MQNNSNYPLHRIATHALGNMEHYRRIAEIAKRYETPAYIKALSEMIDRTTKFYLMPGVMEMYKQIVKSQEVTKALLAVSQGARQLEHRFSPLDLTPVISARNRFYENINERLRAVEERLEPTTVEDEPDQRRIGFRPHF